MKNKKGKKKYSKQTKMLVGGLVALVLMTSLTVYKQTIPPETTMTYKDFKEKVEKQEVDEVSLTLNSEVFTVTLKNGEKYDVTNPGHDEFRKELLEGGVEISLANASKDDAMASIVGMIPSFILMGLMFMMVFRMGTGSGSMFNVIKGEQATKFDDVAGMDDIKKEVQFVVDTIKNYKELEEAGGRPCKGIILEGPPGTGKTLMAKAIAGEAGVPFISTSGADFIEMFVGMGASRVRSLWKLAQENAPCVVFIDEIDAIGSRRSSGAGGGGVSEHNQTINALLQRMDGLSSDSGILVVAATNRIDDLDDALLRPGRFDKRLYIGPPKTKDNRDAIINVHLKGKKTVEDIDMNKVSKLMFGLTGAEIESALNEAVMISIQKERKGVISVEDIDEAVMKLRVSGVIVNNFTEKDRIVAAVHEAGHAVMTLLLGRKLAKVSIVAYSSGVGGVTVEDMEDNTKQFKTQSDFRNDIMILFGGAAAEKVILGEHSLGWQNDLERATIICDHMLNTWGLWENSIVCGDALRSNNRVVMDDKETVEKINRELLKWFDNAVDVLSENKQYIEELRDRLLEEETVLDFKLEESTNKPRLDK